MFCVPRGVFGLVFVCLTGGATHGATVPEGADYTNSASLRFVRIAPGKFQMGQAGTPIEYRAPWSAEKDLEPQWDEQPVHAVSLTKAIYVSDAPVTNQQYERFDSAHAKYRRRDGGSRGDDDAVTFINWNEAVAFCRWMSERDGKPYRLATEAEWEYCCRAGSTTTFYTGNTLPDGFQAISKRWTLAFSFWFPNPDAMPAAYRVVDRPSFRVKQRPPNAWGLYDMVGLVEQWCSDWYGPYESDHQTDPVGRSTGDFRVTRGGPKYGLARAVRSANRASMMPWARTAGIGFRVVLADPPDSQPLPPAPPPLNQQNVAPASALPVNTVGDKPFFKGPRPYVKIPAKSFGPLYSRHNHDSGITQCPNGDLLAVWYSCVEEVDSELCVAASRLRAGAADWEDASPFWDSADRNDHAPAIWWDGDKTLFHLNGNKTLPGSILRTSTDSGATWSEARQIGNNTQPGEHVIRTTDGTIITKYDGSFEGTELLASQDNGRTWTDPAGEIPVKYEFKPGTSGPLIAGIHAGLVQLRDGRLLALGRFDAEQAQKNFNHCTPVSISSDMGRTWQYSVSELPAISWAQRLTMMRPREGPILLCSYTDTGTRYDEKGVAVPRTQAERNGMTFIDDQGKPFTGFGLFAALSFDEGKTWPVRRLMNDGEPVRMLTGIDNTSFKFGGQFAEFSSYLSSCQSTDGTINLITSKNHYAFNLAWLNAKRAE